MTFSEQLETRDASWLFFENTALKNSKLRCNSCLSSPKFHGFDIYVLLLQKQQLEHGHQVRVALQILLIFKVP